MPLKAVYFCLGNDVILSFAYLSPEGATIYDNFEGNTNKVELFVEQILSQIVSTYPGAGSFHAGGGGGISTAERAIYQIILQTIMWDNDTIYLS